MASAEEFVIKLNQQVSGPAGQARGALAQLEAQIRREQEAIGALEKKMSSASAKLEETMKGVGGKVSVDAVKRQRAAIAELQAQMAKRGANVAALEGGRANARSIDALKAVETAEKNAEKAAAARKKKVEDASKAYGPLATFYKKLRGEEGGVGGMFATSLIGIGTAAAVGFGVAGAALLKFGIATADKTKQLQKLSAGLKKNFAETFGGLKVNVLLSRMGMLVGLFDKSTASGGALKFLFERMFQPLVDGAANAIPYIKLGILQLEIAALKLYIKFLPLKKAFDESGAGAHIAKAAMFALGAAAVYGAYSLGALAVAGLVAAAPFIAIGVILASVISIVDDLRAVWIMLEPDIRAAVDGAVKAVTGFASDAYNAATNFVDSFVNGITSKVTAVGDALKSMGTTAKNALWDALGIHSPSRVAIEAAQNVTRTFTDEVDNGKADTRKAFAGMVNADDAGASRGKAEPSGKATAYFDLRGSTFSGDVTESKMRAWLVGILEEQGFTAEPAT